MTELLEVKTYKQPSGIIIQLRRYEEGFERLVNGRPQEWGADDAKGEVSKCYMADWQQFEKSLGSEVL